MTLHDVVRKELTRMLARQLDHTPAAEELQFTIQVMTDDLKQRGLTDADAERVTQAFIVLGPQTQRWPTARMVLECLPPRQETKLLPAPLTKPEVADFHIRNMRETLQSVRSVFRPGESFKDYQDAMHKSGLSQKDFEAKRLVENGWTDEMEKRFRGDAHMCRLGVLPGATPEDITRAFVAKDPLAASDPEAIAERAAIQAE